MLAIAHSAHFVRIAILCMRGSSIVCKFVLAIFLSRYLDLSSVGIFSLAVGATTLGPVLIGFGLVHVIMRDAVLLPFNGLANYLWKYWFFIAYIYSALLSITFFGAVTLGYSLLFPLIICVTYFEHMGNDIVHLLSNQGRPIFASINAFIRSALWILIYIPIAYFFPAYQSIDAVFCFWLIGSVAGFLLFTWSVRNWPWKAAAVRRLDKKWIAVMLRRSFVIYIGDLSFVASQQIDRYVVSFFLGLHLAGIYFIYWSAANVVSTIVSVSILQVERPKLIRAFDESVDGHRELVSSILWTTLTYSCIVGCLAILFAWILFPLLRQADVMSYLGAFALIMLGVVVRNLADVGAMGLFTAHRDFVTTATNCCALLCLLVAQVLFLPLVGLYGAGIAIFLSFGLVSIHRYILLFGKAHV